MVLHEEGRECRTVKAHWKITLGQHFTNLLERLRLVLCAPERAGQWSLATIFGSGATRADSIVEDATPSFHTTYIYPSHLQSIPHHGRDSVKNGNSIPLFPMLHSLSCFQPRAEDGNVLCARLHQLLYHIVERRFADISKASIVGLVEITLQTAVYSNRSVVLHDGFLHIVRVRVIKESRSIFILEMSLLSARTEVVVGIPVAAVISVQSFSSCSKPSQPEDVPLHPITST
jgi:hypothetical protein